MTGSRILHYEIVERLGEGSAGEVYKALDTKLRRFVALKRFPELHNREVGRDAVMREAIAASALNHPNVCRVYDIVEDGESYYIVMEYSDGRTLREAAGTLSIRQIIDIGEQVSLGLAAAHEKGIVHRDVKPENIILRKDGLIQITDFGVALFLGSGDSEEGRPAGSIAGTFQYMSPEQVQGQEVDFRSDIFSIGVVLYELLAGEPPFKNWHKAAVEYEIVHIEPAPLNVKREGISPGLSEIVSECMQKNREERYQSALELAKDLKRVKRQLESRKPSSVETVRLAVRTRGAEESRFQEMMGSPGGRPATGTYVAGGRVKPQRAPRPVWSTVFPFAIVIAIVATALLTKLSMGNGTVITASILPPNGDTFDNASGCNLAVSPDGSYLSFVASDSAGNNCLYVRKLSSAESKLLVRTSGAAYPFWSPDSREIAYFSGGNLMSIPEAGGSPITICRAQSGDGGTWNRKGTIVFSESSTGSLFSVPSSGGNPVCLLSPDAKLREANLRWPCFLPDGIHFLFTAQTSSPPASGDNEICVGSLDGGKAARLLSASSNVQYNEGYILFMRRSVLLAQKFDPVRQAIMGGPIPVADNVQYDDIGVCGTFSASGNGILVYEPEVTRDEEVLYADLTGSGADTLFHRPVYREARLSPDEKMIAFDSYDHSENNCDIWLYDMTRNVATKLTLDPVADVCPCWSPDGRRLVFSSNRGTSGNLNLFLKNTDGSGGSVPLFKFDNDVIADQWSNSGRYLLVQARDYVSNNSGWDLLLLPMSGADSAKKSVLFLGTKYDEEDARFSPDSKWVMYVSNETGERQIFVTPLSGGGSNWQVSVNGARWGKWVDGGKKIFFVSPDNSLMGVDVSHVKAGLSFGKPYRVFSADQFRKGAFIYDVSAKGERAVIGVNTGDAVPAVVTIVSNWQERLSADR